MVGITNVFDVNGCKLTVNSNNKMSFIAFLPKQTNKQQNYYCPLLILFYYDFL